MSLWRASCRTLLFSRVSARNASAKATNAKDDSKAYSKSLLLPKTKFTQWSSPEDSERPYRKKSTGVLYTAQSNDAKGPLFVLHDGPPYANGNLHMGHALNKILKDIIVRFQVLQGRKVNYMPGWDCHGLPIEVKALKELKKEAHQLPATEIRDCANRVARREIEIQREEFKELGIMADWTNDGTYRTLDNSYETQQLRVFQKMVEKGLIYRNYRPVHYSPSSRSALAEAELNYRDDHVSRSVYVLFRADISSLPGELAALSEERKNGIYLMVWTTTPWTLTANMAIAINPTMDYVVVETSSGKIVIVAKDRLPAVRPILGVQTVLHSLSGQSLVDLSYLPLFPSTSRSIAPFRIVPSSHVTSGSGTGLVHCAPAHGAEDYGVFRSLGLLKAESHDSLICHVDAEGRFTPVIADIVGPTMGSRLAGLEVLGDGTDRMIEELMSMEDVLVKEERLLHRYPYDWKTDKPIIVTATSQWFANLDAFKDDALNVLKDVTFYPPESRNRLESFVRSRSEWCISRQRVWGVPIPSLHHLPSGTDVLCRRSLEHILGILTTNGTAAWWNRPVADFLPSYLREEFGTKEGEEDKEWRKGTDTMDVWFDSGSSWALLRSLGIQSESPGQPAYADVCVEGSDQHRGWFQSMLLTAVATAESKETIVFPYRTIITHGMVLDEEGKKMSKSIGNVISPMTIVNGGKDKNRWPAYGADVLRFWAASIDFWRDAPLGPTVLAQAKESLRKIRNTARFALSNIGTELERKHLERVRLDDMSIADKYVMYELQILEDAVFKCYQEYDFPKLIRLISTFADTTLSSFYYQITKDVLYANSTDSVERRAVVAVLEHILGRLTLMVAPITPHLAEEIFHHSLGTYAEKGIGESIFLSKCWLPLSKDPEWQSEWTVEQKQSVIEDIPFLFEVRERVNLLLEKARTDKHLRSSLEAELDILEVGDQSDVIQRHFEFLKTLFIVSDVFVTSEVETQRYAWQYSEVVEIPVSHPSNPTSKLSLRLRVRPAQLAKCPRCWTYAREHERDLCPRCTGVVAKRRQ